MKTNNIIILLALVLTLAACTGDIAPAPEAATLNLIIPDYPTAGEAPEPGSLQPSTRVHWNTPDGFGKWEEGDMLYIQVQYFDAQGTSIPGLDNFLCIARRTGSGWIFDKSVPLPAEAQQLNITAWYIVNYPDCDADINSIVLTSTMRGASVSQLNNYSVMLDPFTLYSTRITFTNLLPDDKVSFKQWDDYSGWCLQSLYKGGDVYYATPKSIPTLTADNDGKLTVYVIIVGDNPDCLFRINDQPADPEWHTFNPGDRNEFGNYRGYSYTIDCTALR